MLNHFAYILSFLRVISIYNYDYKEAGAHFEEVYSLILNFKRINLLIPDISEVRDLVFTSYIVQTLYGPMARYRDSSTSRVYPESVIIMLSKENREIAKSAR